MAIADIHLYRWPACDPDILCDICRQKPAVGEWYSHQQALYVVCETSRCSDAAVCDLIKVGDLMIGEPRETGPSVIGKRTQGVQMMNEGMDFNGGLYTADDVAEYILSAMGAMKLQKLVYYSQAWALVWDERPLFNDRIEASKNGPVIPELFRKHQDQFIVSPGAFGGHPDRLDENAGNTVHEVIRYYGPHNAQWLSDLTHAEDPWKNARRGLDPSDNSEILMGLAALHEYYSSLQPSE